MVADKKTYIVEYDLRSKTDGATKATKATAGLRKETEKLGDTFEDVAKDAKTLDEKLEIYTRHRRELAQKLSEEDDANLRKEFNRTNQRIGFLTKLQKVLSEGAGSAVKAAPSFGKLMGDTKSPLMYGGGAVALGAAAPGLGAMIGGAFSGTVVGAAMAGGILAASQDDRVVSAAHTFGNRISDEFFTAGQSFVGPIQRSLHVLANDFEALNLDEAFAKVAPHLETVAGGIGSLAKNVMPGFNKLLDRAGPYSEAFAEGLGQSGKALGDFLDQVSGSEGSLEGLNMLFGLINGTVVTLGRTINALADTWDAYSDVMAGVAGVLEDIPEPLQKLFFGHSSFSEANDVMEKLNSSSLAAAGGISTAGSSADAAAAKAKILANELDRVNAGFEEYFDLHMDVDEARLAVEKGFLDLQKTLKENGKEWDAYTEKGIENREAVLDQVDALNKRREAELAAAHGNTEAMAQINANYDAAILRLKEMLLKAGMTEEQFDKLAGDYQVNVYVNTIRRSYGPNRVGVSAGNQGPGQGGFFIDGFASGGDTPASKPGDFRPFYTHPGEVMWSDRQHYVSTKAQTEQLARTGASVGGAQNLTMTVMPGGSDSFTHALVELLSRYVRISGGNGAALGITRVG